MTTTMITGASGFVGSNLLLHALRNTDWDFITPISARHQGSQLRLNAVLGTDPSFRGRVRVVHCDLTMPFTHSLFGGPRPDYIWHLAAESHVDRSLADPVPFVQNNVNLMLNMLEYARQVEPQVLFLFSTDEVYGDSPDLVGHREWSPIRPSNPYAASKASQEALAYSWWRAYNVPVVITNAMNLIGGTVYGLHQHPEKYVPKVMKALRDGTLLTVHTNAQGKSGGRCWINVEHVFDYYYGLTNLLREDKDLHYYPNRPEFPYRYNIAGPHLSNLEIAKKLAEYSGKHLRYDLVDFHGQRPGHDPEYALDTSKIQDLGWRAETIDDTLKDIVDFYRKYPEALDEE